MEGCWSDWERSSGTENAETLFFSQVKDDGGFGLLPEILDPHLFQLPFAIHFLERLGSEFLDSLALGVVALGKHDATGIDVDP